MQLAYHKDEKVEVAALRDEVGLWYIDIDEAFANYRKRKYQYFGPVEINGEACHIFFMNTDHCE